MTRKFNVDVLYAILSGVWQANTYVAERQTASLHYLMTALNCLDTGKAPPNTAIPCNIEWFNQNVHMNEYIP